MKYKKGLIIICLIICLFLIASVSAADDAAVQADNVTANEIVSFEEVENQDDAGYVASDEEDGQDEVAVSDENMLSVNHHSFDELQELIDYTLLDDELSLYNDYSVMYGGDTLRITHNMTLNGNGHTLDGGNLKRILTINVDSCEITIKNIKFKNGGNINILGIATDLKGAALFNQHASTKLNIINCEFRHNNVLEYGGAIYTEGPLNITDSLFKKNSVQFGNGGGVYCANEMSIKNTVFSGNAVLKNINPMTDVFLKDIIKSVVSFLTEGYYLHGENIIKWEGLTKFMEKLASCFKDPLNDNGLPMTGGAVYCKKDCTVYDSTFIGNIVGSDDEQAGTSGGAIHCQGDITVHNSTFEDNEVNDWGGGAIFAEKNCNVYDSTFDDNTANKGCAIYCWGETRVYNSEFSSNNHEEGSTWMESLDVARKILELVDKLDILEVISISLPPVTLFSSDGGAIWSQGNCYIESCEFDGNSVCEQGGAIYAKSDLTITGENIFHNNLVTAITPRNFFEKDGGVIFCKGKFDIENSWFYNNMATMYGGAIYCEKDCKINNCTFDGNSALLGGGAIYTEKKSNIYNSSFKGNEANIGGGAIYSAGTTNIDGLTFEANSAKNGGAIYHSGGDFTIPGNNIFKNNKATNGGAIYASYTARGVLRIYGCPFYNNKASKNGGAIYTEKSIDVNNCKFEKNTASEDGGAISAHSKLSEYRIKNCDFRYNKGGSGGAIFATVLQTVSNLTFTKNEATSDDGGAIHIHNYCNPQIASCTFEENTAAKRGGAIHMDAYTGNLKVSDSTFHKNTAGKDGGAVYSNCLGAQHTSVEINDVNFTENSAKEGGAVFAASINKVYRCNFNKNKATSGNGGAIYINCECNPEFHNFKFVENSCTGKGGAIYVGTDYFHLKAFSCEFTKNHADNKGGAIYAHSNFLTKSEVGIQNSKFTGNSATQDGGAVYAGKVSKITGSSFNANTVNKGSGGAIFIDWKCGPNINSCTFEANKAHHSGGAVNFASKEDSITVSGLSFKDNHADGYGGAIYVNCDDVRKSEIKVANCEFTGNSAQQGGAVYTGNLKSASNSAFIQNRATWGEGKEDGDGGAIYIYNRGPIDVTSCRFEYNNAYNRGGAIYVDSYYTTTHLKVSYCTFVGNNAENKKYKGSKGGGHSIYNNGYYDSLDMLWMGKNDPNLKGQFLEGHMMIIFVKPKDTEHIPSNWLNIEMTLNSNEIHANTAYKASIHFYSKDGKQLTKNLPHSNGFFDGDGNFTDVKANLNDVTAKVVFTTNNPTINGHLDKQIVSKSLHINDVLTASEMPECLLGEGENEEFEPQLGPSDFNATIKDFIDLEDENDQVVVSYVVPQKADGKIDIYVDYMTIPSYSQVTVAGQSVNITAANLNIVSPEEYNIKVEYVPNDGESFTIEERTMKAHIYTEQDFSISYKTEITSKNNNVISYFSYPVTGTLTLFVNGTPRCTRDIEELYEPVYVHLSDLNITTDGDYNISASYAIKTTSKEIALANDTIEVFGVDWDANEYVAIFNYVNILNPKDYVIDIDNNGEYINGTVSVYINGTLKLTKSVSPADEKIIYEITVDDLGIYDNIALGNDTVKVIYIKDNNETYELEKTVEFYAKPIFVEIFEVSVGEKDVVKVTYLKGCTGNATLYNTINNQTEDGSQLVKGSVNASADFVNGVAIIPLDSTAEGEYIFILNITGYDNEEYVYVTVKSNSPGYSASVSQSEVTVGNGIVVKFSGPQSEEFAFIILNDEVYKIDSLDNGTINETITGLSVGTHRIKILYDDGSNFYSNTFYVTVKQAPAPAPAKKADKITLSLKKVKVKKSAKKLVLKATLKINGKKVKGKVVKFKFKGKTYKAKTNKKGIAKITIKKKVLKKLKVGKKVKYQATYGKVTKKYTVKIKK